MISNLNLYGTEDVPKVPEEVCNERIAMLKRRLGELTLIHWMNQDVYLIVKVGEGIVFWEKLRDGETL